jgi:catechol O-methyltransferase
MKNTHISCMKHSLLFTLLAAITLGSSSLKPVNVNNKQGFFNPVKNSLVISSSVFLSLLNVKKAAASTASAAAFKIQYPDASSFYQEYKYIQPSDILTYINDCKIKDGDAKSVIDCLENFAIYYPMYKLSREKVDILNNEITVNKPKNILEIGTFFGYSALNMASKKSSLSTITCIEANKDNADVARFVLDKGLGPLSPERQTVKILDGISTKVLDSKLSPLGSVPFDFIFLDHDKDCYLKDLKRLEKMGLLSENCVIVADNVVFPGAPGYLEYVSGGELGEKDRKTGLISDKSNTKTESQMIAASNADVSNNR